MNDSFLWIIKKYRSFRQFKTLNRFIAFLTIVILFVLIAPWLVSFVASMNYNKASYATAEQLWNVARYVTLYEKDIPIANKGTAQLKQAKYTQAATSYETALKIAATERQCAIRLNLGVAQKFLGDQSSVKDVAVAIREYGKGINALTYDACLSSDEFGTITKERLAELTKLVSDMAKKQMLDEDRPNDNEQTNATQDDEKTRQEVLKQRQLQYMNNLQQTKRREETKEDSSAYYNKRAW